jgi:hypothetical protein
MRLLHTPLDVGDPERPSASVRDLVGIPLIAGSDHPAGQSI